MSKDDNFTSVILGQMEVDDASLLGIEIARLIFSRPRSEPGFGPANEVDDAPLPNTLNAHVPLATRSCHEFLDRRWFRLDDITIANFFFRAYKAMLNVSNILD